MDNTLFTSLRKYNKTEGRDPVENFITEAFAWMLKNYADFSSFYLSMLSEKLNCNIDFSNHNWDTQVHFEGVFPDLVCKMVGKNAFVFEHKVRADLHERQIENYRRVAKQKFDVFKIILITGDVSQHAQEPDLQLCWRDIHIWITKWLENKKENINTDLFIFNSFLSLLENEGLGPAAPISYESILYYFQTRDFLKNVRNLVDRIYKKEMTFFKKMVHYSNFNFIVDDRSGRIGLGLHSDFWRPGIFIGIMAGYENHAVIPILGDKSPDFVIIIDFTIDLHNSYPSDNDFMLLIKELSSDIEIQRNGWQFFNHLTDTKAKTNKWHPLYIRKPMIDVFRGTKTNEEQEKKFMECATEILPKILNSPNFINLRNKFI